MKSDSLKSYYSALIRKYPFLKNFIDKNNNCDLSSDELQDKILEISNIKKYENSNIQDLKENDFKQRCLLSLLLKHEITTDNTTNKEQDFSLSL